jgi:hypothetical protein
VPQWSSLYDPMSGSGSASGSRSLLTLANGRFDNLKVCHD